VISKAKQVHQEIKKYKAATSNQNTLTGLATGWEDKLRLKCHTSDVSSLATSASGTGSGIKDSIVQYGGMIGDRETDDIEHVGMVSNSKVAAKSKMDINGDHFNVEYSHFTILLVI
jgi:hypothetical protein